MLESEFSVDEDNNLHLESEDLLLDEDQEQVGGPDASSPSFSRQNHHQDSQQRQQRGEEEESKGREEKRSRNSKRKADRPIAVEEDQSSTSSKHSQPSELNLKRRIVELETDLEKRDDLVEQLTNALELSRERCEEKDLELAQVSQSLLPLAESLHKMQEQLDERDAQQERDREDVELQFAELVRQLDAAREAIQSKEREIQVLQDENQHLKDQIVVTSKKKHKSLVSPPESTSEGEGENGYASDKETSDGHIRRMERDMVDEEVTETEEEYEETMGEAAGPPVRHQHEAKAMEEETPRAVEEEKAVAAVEEQKTSDPIDNFKEEMEREYRKINESLQSAEQFSLMFSKRTKELTSNIYRIREVRELEKEKSKIEESLTEEDRDRDGASADDGFEQKIKSWPREMVEKQLKHYRDAFNSERKSLEEMEEEKNKVEEELMSAKLELEQKQLEVATLQSGKEQLEQYVAQLAEEMENETSQMVSMKEQFQVETLKFADPDFSAYLESDSEGDTTEGGSALASPSMSPITTPRGRGEEGPNAHARDISKRRSLNLDLNGVIAARGKERSKAAHVRYTGPSLSSSSSGGNNPLLTASGSFRSEDEDTATEGMYSEDESRENTEGEEIIGKYREEVYQLREELRTVREELQRAKEERERKGTEVRDYPSSSSSSSITTLVYHHHYLNTQKSDSESEETPRFDFGVSGSGRLLLRGGGSEDEAKVRAKDRAKAKRRRGKDKELRKRRRRAKRVAVIDRVVEEENQAGEGLVPDEPAAQQEREEKEGEEKETEKEEAGKRVASASSPSLSHSLSLVAFSLFAKFKRTI